MARPRNMFTLQLVRLKYLFGTGENRNSRFRQQCLQTIGKRDRLIALRLKHHLVNPKIYLFGDDLTPICGTIRDGLPHKTHSLPSIDSLGSMARISPMPWEIASVAESINQRTEQEGDGPPKLQSVCAWGKHAAKHEVLGIFRSWTVPYHYYYILLSLLFENMLMNLQFFWVLPDMFRRRKLNGRSSWAD